MPHVAAAVSRHWPFPNGSGRILDKFGRSIDLGSGERLARTSDGFPLRVLADDLIGRHILLSGKFDRSIVQVLLDHARPGDTLLDIGANVGYVTGCFLTHVKGSRAICVEPQPMIVDLLRKNLKQFGSRAALHAVALSDKPGELRFHIDKVNRGASRIADDGEIVVPAIAAAELLSSLDKLDLIKIDVEGHELPIFRAIRDQLKRLRPRAILFEDHGTGDEIASLLEDYTIYGIDKTLLKTRLVPINSRVNDYIAVRRTKVFNRKNRYATAELTLKDGTAVSKTFRRPVTFWQAMAQLEEKLAR